ncbi:MAG: metalloregulator ArsR/SmtB family transcription factor [Pseudomonadota bacterium]|nr:metalloregulator ArsR/SmtB family transcription factor [Pseudomonadota bacterium]
MEKEAVIKALGALAHSSRLDIFRLLVQAGSGGMAAGRIGDRLGLPGATLSFHLNALKQAGLIRCQRDSRLLIYSADYEAMSALLSYLTDNCCAGRPDECAMPAAISRPRGGVMSEKVYNVLFLCTGNSARSQMAEAILNDLGGGRFRAYSAGSYPAGYVHPLAVALLDHLGMPTAGLRSKSWDEFAGPDAPAMDFIITVCDAAAGEVCPVWPGQPMAAHWGVEDPAAAQGSELERLQAFRQAFRVLENRIRIFTALPVEKLDRLLLKQRVDAIGRAQPAVTAQPAQE